MNSIKKGGRMDGFAESRSRQPRQPGQHLDVEAELLTIKERMPDTYRAIQAKAGEIGKAAYGYVRRSLAGQPNLFYAVERGRVVGTPFAQAGITADAAQLMVAFGCRALVMWAKPGGASDGA